jgi:hypothetical protein
MTLTTNNMTHSIMDAVKMQMANIIKPVFNALGYDVHMDDIVNELCAFKDGNLEATFSVHAVDNVDRKSFAAAASTLQHADVGVVTFKVKSKRTGRNVRFYLKYVAAPQLT